MKDNPKKVLVVDDSAFMRKLIADILSSHPSLEVIGTARNGKDAITKVLRLKPDVVTMDIEMPIMNGLEALQEIMKIHPVPVVMLSSTTKIGAENTILAMEYGAFDFVAKPGGPISLNLHEVQTEIIEKVLAASRVSIRNLTRKSTVYTYRQPSFKQDQKIQRQPTSRVSSTFSKEKKISKVSKTFVIIGTSTGGPRALQEVLTRLPEDLQAPILIVQHMPPGFTKSLAERLDGISDIQIKEAEDGEVLTDGTAYIAPGGKHLKIVRTGSQYAIYLDEEEPPRMGHRPAVDVLFESASMLSEIQFITVVMTGMGQDGKDGLAVMKSKVKVVAIAESEQTAVIDGMPKAIREAGLADYVVDLQHIAPKITEILNS